MKKELLGWSTFWIVAILNIGVVSCNSDKVEENKPLTEEADAVKDEKEKSLTDQISALVGHWIYLSHQDEYCEMISFSEKGEYQIRSQKGKDSSPYNGGTFLFDRTNNILQFHPRATSDSKGDFSYKVVSISADNMIAVNSEGLQLNYDKVTNTTFPDLPHWGNPWYIGTWKSEYYDEISSQMYDLYDLFIFRNDGTCEYEYNHWGTPHTIHYISYRFSDNYLTLTGKEGVHTTCKISYKDDILTIAIPYGDEIEDVGMFTKQ